MPVKANSMVLAKRKVPLEHIALNVEPHKVVGH